MFTTRPTLQGTFGMVSSTHWLVAQSAMGVLERGGNAFDAAVAGGFVLHVVEPHQNGPGGEVPAIVSVSGSPEPRVLCGQGITPAAATLAAYRERDLDLVPGTGLLALTTPGAVDAWLLLLRDHGTMSLGEVLGPAIGYAGKGFPAAYDLCEMIAKTERRFRTDWPTSAAVWLPGGRVPEPGQLLTNQAYARTLERVVDESEAAAAGREARIDAARRIWREGFVGQAIAAFARRAFRDETGVEQAGLLTAQDLAEWRATWEEPATLDWQGYTIAKTAPWGQGPVLLQALALLEAMGDPSALDLLAARDIHRVVEAEKLAFADREAWYGDGFDTPLRTLVSRAYASERLKLIGDEASGDLRPGRPDGREPKLARRLDECVDRRPADSSGDTAHIDVVDRWGNMIAAMPSGGWLHGSPVIPELGWCLGTRGQMFWLEDGLPTSMAPGRRPRTTLSPTLVSRDGVPVLACGSPGGDQQDQWQLLFLMRYLAGGQSLQEAIDAPAWHTQSFPSSFHPRTMVPRGLVVEDRLGPAVIADLERRGHRITRAGDWELGRLCAVGRDPETGLVSAGANPRGMLGYAAGR